MVSSIIAVAEGKNMELEPKKSLSADMPSLLSRSSEAFNGGSEYRSASDLSMFSSSLPTLFHEKLNMTDSDSWLSFDDSSPNLNKLGIGNSEKDSLEDVEPDSLDILLPEDENELLPGLIDELNFTGLPDEDLEECDVFCTGGGMELDVESQDNQAVDASGMQISDRGAANAFVPRKRPNTAGRVSVEHPNGEHPSRTLFVRNINSSVEDSELSALFEPFGEIRSLYTACKSRGFVMISYYDIRAAHAAMRALQNTLLRKRTLDIHFSIPKENPSEKDMNQGTLVIFNVDTTVSNDELLQLFGAYGEIREIRETPNRRFHRFIEYYDVRDAETALKALNRSEIGGKCIKLELSRPGGARRLSVPSQSQDLDRNEVTNFYNQVGSHVANSPPGNWPIGSPVKGSPSHAFTRPHGLGMVRPVNSDNMPGLASILPAHPSSFHGFSPVSNDQGLLNHPNQTILNKGLMHNISYGQPHSLPEHITGGISNSMRFLAPHSGFGTSSDHRYRWGSPPQHMNYPGYTGVSSLSSSTERPFTVRQGFPFSERQASLLGKYQHHVGSAPSSIHINTQMNCYPGSPEIPLGFGDMGINRNYINAHGKANLGVSLPGNRSEQDFTGFGMSSLPTVPFGGSRGLQSVRPEPFADQGRIHNHETHSQNQFIDVGRYHIDLDRIASGDEIRTTLIINNIPNKYTYKMLVAEIDEKHKGDYDFLCLPTDFKNKCNMGHAFINMVSPLHIVPFQQTFSGKIWEKFNSGKVASLAYAEIQGKSALASYMQTPSSMKEEKQLFPEVSYHDEGQGANDHEQLFSSIWNITAPDSDWSYTMDLIENPRENSNSKNAAEESS
ncbi:RNA-binding domain superfamily [Arabidopsis thaliana x Arabidopsis arenosa]|uniref:RNA-binding domain superfamily n=1 Tax=Arabidopsis thaliana x Arabidopsis arenosa TaxID=1240361 RepID=A0A8T2AAW7_9BRAS|nr:RNA-binding domain superfamily [Arabidopsis thaliana x Arabidopsis arenosa]